MVQILESDIDVLIDSGFIYLPLMYDLSIEDELSRLPQRQAYSASNRDLVEVGGKYYLKSLSIRSLLENYGRFDPETYEYLRKGVFNKFLRTLNPGNLMVDEKLGAVVFQVMPYFLRKKDRLHRILPTGEEILDIVSRTIDIPPRFLQEANRYLDSSALHKKFRSFAGVTASDNPPFTGLVAAKSFRQWFLRALEARIVEEEKTRMGNLIYNREKFAGLQKKYIAVLLFVNERGTLEISGCGFFRNRATSEYFVFLRTGAFALKDLYGRLYLFPDCRVGVSTVGPTVPYVLDRYKHPFLKGFDTFQKICVRGDFIPSSKFNAAGAIQAIEEGVSALFHGYNSRRGNGYHRLDGMKIEENSIVFEEFRIPPDDPRIISGEVEVKNDFY